MEGRRYNELPAHEVISLGIAQVPEGRKIFQQLEAAGYVAHTSEGRMVTAAGRSFLDNVANNVKSQVSGISPGIAKY